MAHIIKPRPNVRMGWRICRVCTVDFLGTSGEVCPRCQTFEAATPSAAVCWTLILGWVTIFALALTGVYFLVGR
jgi:hypothetical protein